MEKSLNHKKFALRLHEKGIYELTVFSNEELLLSDIHVILEEIKVLGGKKLPVLVICGEFATTNNDVLKYLSKNENFPYSKAGAYVVHSIAQRIMANFYLKINEPERPTKFFNNQDEALEWLLHFL